MADSEVYALAMRLQQPQADRSNSSEFSFLVPQNTQPTHLLEYINSTLRARGNDCTFKRNDQQQVHNCMTPYTWTGPNSDPFLDVAKELLASDYPSQPEFWLSHPMCDDATELSQSIHNSQFDFCTSECSMGAFTDPLTFSKHGQVNLRQIKATFDFSIDTLTLCLADDYKLDVSFLQIKNLFVVKPSLDNGKLNYTVFIYFASVPRLWKKEQKAKTFNRILSLPGIPGDVIGHCSVLKLRLEWHNFLGADLMALTNKLLTSQFKVWWAPMKTVPAKRTLRIWNEIESAPWSIRWLLSEGFRVIDQLTKEDIDFLKENEHSLYAALQGVLSRDIIVSVMNEFRNALSRETLNLKSILMPDLPNYTLIPKLVVTPTRLIFLQPSPVPMNRVLRTFGTDNFITVSFRDEDSFHLTGGSEEQFTNLITRIKTFLQKGLRVDGKVYELLGCSNSQLRHHSCWMYARNSEYTVDDIRHWVGDLDEIRCVATYVARIGQSFSSSTSTLDLSGSEYMIREVPDVNKGKYCFTDGVGRISEDVALKVAKMCGAGHRFSAFQIRLGGCKGVLTLDPSLPQRHVLVRPSMTKFHSDHKQLEVLDYSRPHELFMNKQVILLLSQRGIPDEIFFKFQEAAIRTLMNGFASNDDACQLLRQLDLDVDVLKAHQKGLDIISDPFFRSLLLENYEEHLRSLLYMTHIPIPVDQGRQLIGVADETKKLSDGQVFIQYSNNIKDTSAGTSIVRGRVVITKNPCLHPGDVRVFDAVDYPELHHLVDCLVFPVKGRRPHPNEISGSDLDGDLYWATWHPDLIIKKNYPPMHFPKAKSFELDHVPEHEDIIEYIGEYIKNDRLGTIANAHIAYADAEHCGIYSERCIKLAEIHSEAVDFPKTGNFPNIESDLMPKKYPDFMMKEGEIKYESQRILGKLFRDVSQLWQSLCLYRNTMCETSIFNSHTNKQLEHQIQCHLVNDPYYSKAKQYYSEYARAMQYLLDTYGLQEEASLLVGSVHKIKQGILTKHERIECGVFMKSQVRKLRRNYRVVLRERDLETGVNMKALLWYKVSYDDGRFKSFAWIALSQLVSLIDQQNTKPPMSPICHKNPLLLENLNNQKDACQLFLKVIEERVPQLRCSLEHINLTRWNIVSNDVYFKLSGNDPTVLKQEFAKLCLLIPSLNLSRRNTAFGSTDCFITKRGLQQMVLVNNRLLTIHIYYSGIYDKILSQVTSRLDDSLWFRSCFQYFSQFWMISGKQRLQDIITVLHLADMILRYMDHTSNNASSRSIFDSFRWCTLFSNLRALNETSSELWSLPSYVLRSLEQNFMEGLQLMSLSGDYDVLDKYQDNSSGRPRRRIIPVSQTASAILSEMQAAISNMLTTRSGCSISIKQTEGRKGHLHVVEAFGSERQLKKLTDEIQHFEFITSGLSIRKSGDVFIQEVIFMFGQKDDSEKLNVVPYRGPVNISHNKDTYMIGFERTHFHRSKVHTNFLSSEDVQKWEHLLENMLHHCDSHYHGDIIIICRFSCYHFSRKDVASPESMTVGEFCELVNNRRIYSSFFSYDINSDKMINYLTKEIGLEPAGTENTTICHTKVADNEEITIVYDKDFKLKQLRHQPINLGCLQVITEIPPGSCDSKADIRLQLQITREIREPYMERYAEYANSKNVLRIFGDYTHSEMPELGIRKPYRNRIRFIRQKKVQSYVYSSAAKQQNCDHFTMHLKVDINKVREYKTFKEKTGRAADIKEYTDVNVVLPSVPPLHYKEDHRELINKLVDFCIRIRDVIQET